ncbi:sigma-70 family RNA polymerase sigma factor [Fulvivirgaceae bacterium BMA12]|uniref:Sigma-70 family RNA polymerase sigma factor n=1 Tax=Agaribacillus aureus TaxID=3051825 RepID=A0ABT8LHK4_9BACT|nr:sigma-70 family RNA polymerase sigma factor [Fulvivirgaceae bacterium BMA12]
MEYKIDIVFKKEYTRLIAVLVKKFGSQHIDLIEDAVQEAFFKALKLWPAKKPDNPSAWIMLVTKNHLLDQFKKADTRLKKDLSEAQIKQDVDWEMPAESEIVDSQLRMIFACCHPDIKPVDQLMLSLKFLCGFGNEQISRALLKKPEAIAKALTRAKQKFRSKVKDFSIPGTEELKPRLSNVLKVIYLQFNEGYKLSSGDQLVNKDLCWDAIKLAELIASNPHFDTSKINALLALMYFQASRFHTRLDENNRLLTLEHQDRSQWNQKFILQGNIYLGRAVQEGRVSRYHFEAAIASYHATAKSFKETNWDAILGLYDLLIANSNNPVYLLNRIIAFGQINSPEATLALVGQHERKLPDNHIIKVFIGGLYEQLNDRPKARESYTQALKKVQNELEKQFILAKLQRL